MVAGIDRVIDRKRICAISPPSLQRSPRPNDPFSMAFRRVTALWGRRWSQTCP